MERRKTPRKDWVITKDDVGRAVLEWKVDVRRAKRLEADACARTYDFLEQLDVPDLSLEDDVSAPHRELGVNPYDTGVFKLPKRRED